MLQLQRCKITFIFLLKKSICNYQQKRYVINCGQQRVRLPESRGLCRHIFMIKCDVRIAKNMIQSIYISLHSIKKIQNFALIVIPRYDLDKTLNFSQYSCRKSSKVADNLSDT